MLDNSCADVGAAEPRPVGIQREGEAWPRAGKTYFQRCDGVRSLLRANALIMHSPSGGQDSCAGGQLH